MARESGGAHPQRRNQKTSERVALDIVRDIVEQRLHIDDHLPLEAEMIEQYHVSRGSLREGLRLLEVQGLIRMKPGPRGGPVLGSVDAANLARTAMMYFQLSASTYNQVFETQALFEPITARLAARHPARKSVMVRFTEGGPLGSESDYRVQTAEFHEAIYGLVDNPVLALITSAVAHIASDHVLANMDPIALRPAILHEHTAIAKTIAAGKSDQAGKLMASHFQSQLDFYRERWPGRLLELVQWR